MINNRLTGLVNKFKELQLEQQEVAEEIERVCTEISQQQRDRQQAGANTRVSPRVVRPATGPGRRINTITGETTIIEAFGVGDRVRITNKIRKPADRPINDGDRKGTVEEIDIHNGRIHIITDNGTKTWRLTKNLKHI